MGSATVASVSFAGVSDLPWSRGCSLPTEKRGPERNHDAVPDLFPGDAAEGAPVNDTILQSFIQNGPWAAAAGYLGREMLKAWASDRAAWAEDRKRLHDVSERVAVALGELKTVVSELGDRLEEIERDRHRSPN
jgi:hypothetical protein